VTGRVPVCSASGAAFIIQLAQGLPYAPLTTISSLSFCGEIDLSGW
jgi:hypothetical protein